jgi:hypothetical protein
LYTLRLIASTLDINMSKLMEGVEWWKKNCMIF